MKTPSTSEELLQKALDATTPARNYTNTDRWIPAVKALRGKGWSWSAIYKFLKADGQPVQKEATFIASMSRRYKNELRKLTAEGAGK